MSRPGNPVNTVLFGAVPLGSRNTPDDNVKANLRILNRAVVIHTLNDPSLRDLEKDAHIISTLVNPDLYKRAPRNSIICRIITDEQGRSKNSDLVCYPFFSSHLMMPIKAGEQVWIFFEQPETQSNTAFWMSRIAEPIDVEDANFTHGARRYQATDNQPKLTQKVDDGSGNFVNERKLTFPNGSPLSPQSAPLLDDNGFLNIISESKESELFKIEPVPRLTKRPGDFVIQGSNNNSITLGTIEGWDSQSRPDLSTKNSAASGASLLGKSSIGKTGVGIVDIVTGRGRIFQDTKAAVGDPKKRESSIKNSTRPLVVENQLGFETDKNVASQQKDVNKLGNLTTNPQEGDPDFLLDASRILLASNADIDLLLDTADSVAQIHGGSASAKSGPAIALKSDHIRIVARKTGGKNSSKEPDDTLPTNGTIRIIKEGSSGEDLASIVIQEDGSIHIIGKSIYLESNGSSSKTNSQPFVRYDELEKLWKDTMKSLSDFCQTLTTNQSPGFGAPNPQVTQAALTLKTTIETNLKNRISEVKSDSIYGQ